MDVAVRWVTLFNVSICARPAVSSGAGKFLLLLFILGLLTGPGTLHAQQADTTNKTTQTLTLKDCIDYALKNQPAIKQAQINLAITHTSNFINASGWLPQAGVNANFVHYIQLPATIVANPQDPNAPPTTQHFGVANTFIPEVYVDQAIFTPALLYAVTSAPIYEKQAHQVIDSTKIYIVSSVSKAFYNLLLTLQQINVLKEDTIRLTENLNNAYHQYVGGIVDESDYDEAAISLNNSKAQLRQAKENVVPQYALLKQLMGYKPQEQFNVSYDTSQMVQDIIIDTTQQLQYEKRIEFQQLMTARQLQHSITAYNAFTFLPSLSGYYNYNYEFENNDLSKLFTTSYPNSLVGLTLNLPLFTGLSRVANIHRSKLQEQLLTWREVGLKSEIYTEYTTALASYNGNLYNMYQLQDNVMRARKVYNIVQLQYKQGIVPYLNVITAESNLITSQIGYLNALFQVLGSKIDLEKAMGIISY